MKSFYLFAIIFLSMFFLAGVAIVQQPTPLKEPPLTIKEQAVDWLSTDMEIHLSYLEKPEEPIYAAPYINTGSHEFHKKWADDFGEIIKFIKREPSKYNKQECLDLLGAAQSTHAGVISCDYAVLLWNYEWFEKYDKIIELVKTRY